jgi:hypothetical protein
MFRQEFGGVPVRECRHGQICLQGVQVIISSVLD